MKRACYIIAIQGNECFIRRTEYVTHDFNNREIRYAAKNVTVSRAPKYIQTIFKTVKKQLSDSKK